MTRCIIWTVLVAAGVASAVQPTTVEHTSQADFAAGELENVAVWSLGEVTLAPAVETVLESFEEVDVVSAIAAGADGTVYVGSAPKAVVVAVAPDGSAEVLADLPGAWVSSLLIEGDTLLAASAGGEAGVYRIDLAGDGEYETVWTDEEVSSVWAIARAGESLLAATGSEGRLYAISPDGDARVLLDVEPKVLRSLAVVDRRVYVGTGEQGRVYTVDVDGSDARVVLDVDAPEIVRLLPDRAGGVYAAATGVTTAEPAAPIEQDLGAPDNATATVPAASPPATQPSTQPTTQPAQAQAGQPASAPAQQAPASGVKPNTGPSEGNAIYRIGPDGLVHELAGFEQTIHDLAEAGGALFVATGGDGLLHEIRPTADATARVADLDATMLTALAAAPDGSVLIGTADQAGVQRISAGAAETGVLISGVIDAEQIARFTQIRVQAISAERAALGVSVRSGNTAEADDETWSDFSAEMPVTGQWQPIATPAGRFAQYRLHFNATDEPVRVIAVQTTYQVDNLSPRIESIGVTPSATPEARNRGNGNGGGQAMPFRVVQFAAADGNGDSLVADVYYRRAGHQVWITAAEDVSGDSYPWNSTTVPDGEYEVKVIVRDTPDNPAGAALSASRISRAVTVDNTAPAIVSLTARPGEDGTVTLTVSAEDASRLAGARFVIDSGDEEHLLTVVDGVVDSPQEQFRATLEDLDAGAHVFSVTVVDEFGNVAREAVEVTVGQQ